MNEESKFFNIFNYIGTEKLTTSDGKPFKLENMVRSYLLMFQSERNIGKTTSGVLDLLTYEIDGQPFSFTWEKNTIFMRNTFILAIKFAKGVIALFPERNLKLEEKTGIIYEFPQDWKPTSSKKGNKEKYVVGLCAALNRPVNAKGLAYNKVNLIIYDEFNEAPDPNKPWDTGVVDQYAKFLDMHKSFTRFNNVLTVGFANRNNVLNEFFVRLGIDIYFDVSDGKDYIERITSLNNKEKTLGWWVEVGFGKYQGLANKETLTNELAMFDSKLDSFYDKGGFRHKVERLVLNWHRYVKDTCEAIDQYIISERKILTLVKFEFEGKETYCLTDEIEKREEGEIITLTNIGHLVSRAVGTDSYSEVDIIITFAGLFREGRLLATNNDILRDMFLLFKRYTLGG